MDGGAYKSDDSSRSMHEVLIDERSMSIDDELDRQKLTFAIKGVLSNLTPREETVLRLRFGITEDLLDTKEEEDVNA